MPPYKNSKEYAPGIPDARAYGDPIKGLKPGALVEYVLQHHKTKRNPKVPHYDLRLGTPKTNLFSWAVPKAELPPPGESRPIFQTHLHAHQYGDFEGEIGHGYGAGTVKLQDRGKALITKTGPNTIHFTLANSKVPVRYVLVSTGGKNWILMAKKEPGSVPGVGDKPVFRQIKAEDQDSAIDQATEVQEKIDGAHGVLQVGDKGDVDLFSVNPRTTGEPIRHTERIRPEAVRVPPKFKGTGLRGEMYFVDPKGRAVPFSEISGILNSRLDRSLETQGQKGLQGRVALFDALGPGSRKVRQDLLQDLLAALPGDTFHAPQTATTAAGKRKLVQDIQSGRNPRTQEGVMAVMPDESVQKLKNKTETTGYITGTYPGTGKRQASAGGLTAITDRNNITERGDGKNKEGVELRIGSGFTEQELRDMATNIKDYIGKPIRIEGMAKLPSGKIRAPVYGGLELDKAAQLRELPEAVIRSKTLRALFASLDPQYGHSDATAVRIQAEIKRRLQPQVHAALRRRHGRGFGQADYGRAADGEKYAGVGSLYAGLARVVRDGVERRRRKRHMFKKGESVDRLPIDLHQDSPFLIKIQFCGQDGAVKAGALVELADTPELRSRGLQGRKFLPDNRGMLFDKAGSYWMKDVNFPLDLVWLDKSGTVLDCTTMQHDPEGQTIYRPKTAADHAVELPAHYCTAHDIKAGDVMAVDFGCTS